jgi:hypothetical protein
MLSADNGTVSGKISAVQWTYMSVSLVLLSLHSSQEIISVRTGLCTYLCVYVGIQ